MCSTAFIVVIDSRKGADPDTSYTARLFSRGRQQIAKKLGEEAVEALIEGIRGDRPKLVGESADMLYHLLTLWAAVGVKPSGLDGAGAPRGPVAASPKRPRASRNSGPRRRAAGPALNRGHGRLRSQQHLRAHPARRAAVQESLRGRLRARLPRHQSAGAGACPGDPQGRIRLQHRFQRHGADRD